MTAAPSPPRPRSARGVPDVFAGGLRLPPRVCVLAPGPAGGPFHRRIPAGYFVLGVSKAALIDGVGLDLWLMTHGDQDWYGLADARHRGPRIYSRQALAEADPPPPRDVPCFAFEATPPMIEPGHLPSVDHGIRYGGTVTGVAVQLAYRLGATDLLLCGADMSGDGYWDGSENTRVRHGDTWLAVERLNLLMGWLRRERGLRIATLSPTRLDLPTYRPGA